MTAPVSPDKGALQTPYPDCRYEVCDLPGQCKAEGRCHHPDWQKRALHAEQTLEEIRGAPARVPPIAATGETPMVGGGNLRVFLDQAGAGCISGYVSEWAQLKPACAWAGARIDQLERELADKVDTIEHLEAAVETLRAFNAQDAARPSATRTPGLDQALEEGAQIIEGHAYIGHPVAEKLRTFKSSNSDEGTKHG